MLVLVIAHAGVATVLPWWARRTGRPVWVIAALPLLAALVLLSALGPNLAPAPRRTRTPAEGDLTR
ncbi:MULTISPECIES: hypothetical protein [Streptomyces]|uniref:Uncharacterized protein n=2 Tax=Streptomyces TaxID=1883 RepID=A0A420UZ03_9ACTN|nr:MULTISPECIES: hypothetical protein [Streptomyces]KNE78926.1 hypothetical protein ADZ36_30540 [Streptomyces fradiae]OFA47350.1 hypothetical protein BEN35_20780 [Streptomyces fradiae]PQM21753.1 hypothetical protein Sfr7A_19125 [Streptomyces xinghaiensis]RKM93186.1 hypothetical protein SFRA_022015 [Streptomyces xinghaiensis]RNC71216.1 hypothetical protein DC095_023375 [Streptomyces xinghaiensis]